MSYLDYFLKNVKKDESPDEFSDEDHSLQEPSSSTDKRPLNNDTSDVEKIQGCCHTMCPMDESCLRIREKMVHILEKSGEDIKLVKSYSRSAADTNMAVPLNLRPFNILRVTVAYLLFEVTKQTDVPTIIIYDFINDRLRAVRQDMTIQRLSPQQCAHLLDPMIRFYVYYGYRLHGFKHFDPVLHKTYLLECLKWFLTSCDSSKDLHYGDEQLTPSELGSLMTTMNIDHGDNELACDHMLMESLYILCNLDDVYPLRRYVNLPVEIKRTEKLRLAANIAVANRKGNFVKVTRMLNRLCPLSHCALCQYLPELQKRALGVLTLAYSNKMAVPASVIKQWLAFSSLQETIDVCQYYGLQVVDGNAVRFEKGSLKTDVKMHQTNIRLLKSETLNLTLPHVLTYTTK